MPEYRVHRDAAQHARTLIDGGDHDDTTEWSDAAPSTEQADEVTEKRGWDGFAR